MQLILSAIICPLNTKKEKKILMCNTKQTVMCLMPHMQSTALYFSILYGSMLCECNYPYYSRMTLCGYFYVFNT